MKILSIGNFGRSWDESICDEEHVAQALERSGHEVYRLQRESCGNVVAGEFDFTLIAQWDGYPHEMALPRPVVYWAFDYQADGQEWHERLVEGANLYLSKRIADSKYPNWQWLPQDFAPEFLEPRYDVEQDVDVLFTGSYLPWATERTEILKAIDEQFNLVVHSVTATEWRQQGLKNVFGPLVDYDLPQLYGRAKINISIDHTIEAGYWSDRNAQIMACGGFVLFRYVPMSEVVFGHNVAYFYGIEDCLRKVRHYLDNEFERGHIAQIGRGYAAENLMVSNRVEQLLTIVEGIL